MRETLLKSIAVLVALGGAGVLVWFAMRDPKAPDAGEVQETLHNSMGLLKEGLAGMAKAKSFGAGADKVKEGTFQVSNAVSKLKKLRSSDKAKAVDQLKENLREVNATTAELVWTPGVGVGIWDAMYRVFISIERGTDLPMPALSQLSGQMMEAINSLNEALGDVKDAATAEAAGAKLKEIDGMLDAAKETRAKLTEEERATLQELSKPALEKLKKLADKTLAKPGVAEKGKAAIDGVVGKLTALAS